MIEPTRKNSRIALAGAIAFFLLFHEEWPGYNYPLFALVIAFLQGVAHPTSFGQKPVWLTSLAFLMAAGSVAWQASTAGIILTWIFLFLQAAFIQNPSLSDLSLACTHALSNSTSSLPGILKWKPGFSFFHLPSFSRLILALLTPLLLIVFWNLYADSNPFLMEIHNQLMWLLETAFGDWPRLVIEFISPEAWLFTALGLLLLLPAFHSFLPQATNPFSYTLSRTDLRNQKEIFLFRLFAFKGSSLRQEFRSARLLLIALNAILLLVNLTDIAWIWMGFQVPEHFSLKQFVHDGTWKLLFSIVLSLILILYFFRGNQNFYPRSRMLRALATLWILQNGILLISLFLRDWHYIQFHGMAWNRMNLLVFLMLTLSGLITMLLKVQQRKTLRYLIQQNGIVLLTLLLVYAWVPLDSIMIRYNLRHPNPSGIDVDFYLEAGETVLPIVLENRDQIVAQIAAHQGNSEQWIEHDNAEKLDAALARKIHYFLTTYPGQSTLSRNYRNDAAVDELMQQLQAKKRN